MLLPPGQQKLPGRGSAASTKIRPRRAGDTLLAATGRPYDTLEGVIGLDGKGKGIGGRLIVEMANSLAAEGLRPVFLCAPERVRFYTRLGFAKQAEYARYVPEKC